MNDSTKVRITALALKKMTAEQFTALQENILADGRWETADGVVIMADFDTIMVSPVDKDGISMIHIGIEPDGWTHS